MFIGKLAFIVIGLMAFWMLLFLAGMIVPWFAAYFSDLKAEKKAAKKLN